jgi:glutathione S-transferase
VLVSRITAVASNLLPVAAWRSGPGEARQKPCRGWRWFSDQYSVADPYLLVFYVWGLRRGYPMQELKNFTAMKDSLMQRPAVQHVLAKEKIDV